MSSYAAQDKLCDELAMLDRVAGADFADMYFPGKFQARELDAKKWRVDWFGTAEGWVQDVLQLGNHGATLAQLTTMVKLYRRGIQFGKIYHD